MNLVGQHIGSYVVDRLLGAGGTGAVYACRHTLIDREVAVKVLHDDQARDPDQVARFFQEAKAAADIGHPNIIGVIDYGTIELPDGARTYLMMESLVGESLDKRLRGRGLTLDEIGHVMAQIASALIACHRKGIIHRDLKPSNIYLCAHTFDPLFVKVLDFGTAKLAAPTPGVRRTQYGVVIGTPPYMSPEQCEGKGQIDHRSDIYSLGVILYEMLTRTLPFDGQLGDVMIGHLTKTPEPPSRRNPAVPPAWEALCLRMLEKPRERRPQTAAEVAAAIDALRGEAAAYETFRPDSGQNDVGVAPTVMAAAIEPPDAAAACAALVTDARHAGFARALMLRPAGRWFLVSELVHSAGVVTPAKLPEDPELYATWTEHPRQDPERAAVAFVSLRTGWSTVVPCHRARW